MLNSCHPLVCAPPMSLRSPGASLFRSYGGKLPSSFNVILSSALVCSTCPPVSVSGTVRCRGYFLEPRRRPVNPVRPNDLRDPSHPCRLTNINVIPIDYASRPRLRDRLTLRRLTLRRNPWTFGDTVFHSVCRYSCQHSHFRRLQEASRLSLHQLTERSATASCDAQSFGSRLEPRYIFGAETLKFRPVSCYAFFKGWLLLSQPPGCFGISTSFPT